MVAAYWLSQQLLWQYCQAQPSSGLGMPLQYSWNFFNSHGRVCKWFLDLDLRIDTVAMQRWLPTKAVKERSRMQINSCARTVNFFG